MPASFPQSPAPAGAAFANKLVFATDPLELKKRIEHGGNVTIIDVREAEDFGNGHVPGARNLPRDKWATREGLSASGINVLYANSTGACLAAEAAAEFAASGFVVMELSGGFEAWQQNKLPIDR